MARLGDFWVFLVLVFGWGGEGVVGQFLGDERVVVVGLDEPVAAERVEE